MSKYTVAETVPPVGNEAVPVVRLSALRYERMPVPATVPLLTNGVPVLLDNVKVTVVIVKLLLAFVVRTPATVRFAVCRVIVPVLLAIVKL